MTTWQYGTSRPGGSNAAWVFILPIALTLFAASAFVGVLAAEEKPYTPDMTPVRNNISTTAEKKAAAKTPLPEESAPTDQIESQTPPSTVHIEAEGLNPDSSDVKVNGQPMDISSDGTIDDSVTTDSGSSHVEMDLNASTNTSEDGRTRSRTRLNISSESNVEHDHEHEVKITD